MRAAAATPPTRQSQEGSEPPGVLLERLDAQQFEAGGRRRAVTREVAQRILSMAQ